MIKAVHTLIYSDDPEATRAFFRDVLRWPSVAEPGATPPWPIFRAGPAELAVHPTSGGSGDEAYAYRRHHSISFMCDDVAATKAPKPDHAPATSTILNFAVDDVDAAVDELVDILSVLKPRV